MLKGQGGYKIRLELAIQTPGCPLNMHCQLQKGCGLVAVSFNIDLDHRHSTHRTGPTSFTYLAEFVNHLVLKWHWYSVDRRVLQLFLTCEFARCGIGASVDEAG